MPSQFMIDIEGTELVNLEPQILKHPNVGGIILFTRNFSNPAQLQKLLRDIYDLNSELIIAVDHEGGYVQRFQRQGFSSIPSARSYGKVYDRNQQIGIEHAQEYGELMAKELIACGINLSLAPVLDVADKSTVISGMDRAFHAHPSAIVDLAGAFIKGMNTAGMPAVGKHYPGHGSVISDSHNTMPVSSATLNELMAKDLKPFVELINQGLLAAIMPAHITYTEIDPENPAGFSKIWLQDLLRTQLGFKGLILSDCLSMKGADIGNLSTRAEKALNAGCDMLIVSHQPRELLLELIQTSEVKQRPESAEYIKSFKKQILGFSKEKTKSDYSELVPEQLTLEKPGEYDFLNKTTSV
jgi:beta-N-acetylhexosaminidase